MCDAFREGGLTNVFQMFNLLIVLVCLIVMQRKYGSLWYKLIIFVLLGIMKRN